MFLFFTNSSHLSDQIKHVYENGKYWLIPILYPFNIDWFGTQVAQKIRVKTIHLTLILKFQIQ